MAQESVLERYPAFANQINQGVEFLNNGEYAKAISLFDRGLDVIQTSDLDNIQKNLLSAHLNIWISASNTIKKIALASRQEDKDSETIQKDVDRIWDRWRSDYSEYGEDGRINTDNRESFLSSNRLIEDAYHQAMKGEELPFVAPPEQAEQELPAPGPEDTGAPEPTPAGPTAGSESEEPAAATDSVDNTENDTENTSDPAPAEPAQNPAPTGDAAEDTANDDATAADNPDPANPAAASGQGNDENADDENTSDADAAADAPADGTIVNGPAPSDTGNTDTGNEGPTPAEQLATLQEQYGVLVTNYNALRGTYEGTKNAKTLEEYEIFDAATLTGTPEEQLAQLQTAHDALKAERDGLNGTYNALLEVNRNAEPPAPPMSEFDKILANPQGYLNFIKTQMKAHSNAAKTATDPEIRDRYLGLHTNLKSQQLVVNDLSNKKQEMANNPNLKTARDGFESAADRLKELREQSVKIDSGEMTLAQLRESNGQQAPAGGLGGSLTNSFNNPLPDNFMNMDFGTAASNAGTRLIDFLFGWNGEAGQFMKESARTGVGILGRAFNFVGDRFGDLKETEFGKTFLTLGGMGGFFLLFGSKVSGLLKNIPLLGKIPGFGAIGTLGVGLVIGRALNAMLHKGDDKNANEMVVQKNTGTATGGNTVRKIDDRTVYQAQDLREQSRANRGLEKPSHVPPADERGSKPFTREQTSDHKGNPTGRNLVGNTPAAKAAVAGMNDQNTTKMGAQLSGNNLADQSLLWASTIGGKRIDFETKSTADRRNYNLYNHGIGYDPDQVRRYDFEATGHGSDNDMEPPPAYRVPAGDGAGRHIHQPSLDALSY